MFFFAFVWNVNGIVLDGYLEEDTSGGIHEWENGEIRLSE